MKFLQCPPEDLTIWHNLCDDREVQELLAYYSDPHNRRRPIPVFMQRDRTGKTVLGCLDGNFQCYASRIFEDQHLNVVVLETIADFRKLTEVCIEHYYLDSRVLNGLLAHRLISPEEGRSIQGNKQIYESVFYENDNCVEMLRMYLRTCLTVEKIESIITASHQNKEMSLYRSSCLRIASEWLASKGRRLVSDGINLEDLVDISDNKRLSSAYRERVRSQTEDALQKLEMEVRPSQQSGFNYTGVSDQTSQALNKPSFENGVIYPRVEALLISVMYENGYDDALREILSMRED